MAPSHARLVGSIIVASLVAAACTSAAPATPEVSPAASPSSPITLATASPTAAATPATPSPTPTPTPQPTFAPTPVPVPPKPSGVRFDQQVRESDDGEVASITQTVTWRAPRNEGVEIQVYGVTKCIARPADPLPDTSGPCLVVHTPLPASVRTLLATAPASDGVISWTWTEVPGCDERVLLYDLEGPAYHAVVLAAYGASGHSIFAIAEPGLWWEPAPGDTVC